MFRGLGSWKVGGRDDVSGGTGTRPRRVRSHKIQAKLFLFFHFYCYAIRQDLGFLDREKGSLSVYKTSIA